MKRNIFALAEYLAKKSFTILLILAGSIATACGAEEPISADKSQESFFSNVVGGTGDGPTYRVYPPDSNDSVCRDVEKILADPVNLYFGSFDGAWALKRELHTTEFKIPKNYAQSYHWIKWEVIDAEHLYEYVAFSEHRAWMLTPVWQPAARTPTPPFIIQKAMLPLPIEGTNKLLSLMMLRVVGGHKSPDNSQLCYLPTQSQSLFSDTTVIDFNGEPVSEKAGGIYRWCNFLQHDGHLYWATWGNRGGDMSIHEVTYNGTELKKKYVCSFETSDGTSNFRGQKK